MDRTTFWHHLTVRAATAADDDDDDDNDEKTASVRRLIDVIVTSGHLQSRRTINHHQHDAGNDKRPLQVGLVHRPL